MTNQPDSFTTSSEVPGGGACGVLPILLAAGLGGRRALPLARAVGVPVALLPFDATRSILDAWLALVSRCWTDSPPLAVVSDSRERALFERVVGRQPLEIWFGGAESLHRGSAGIARDAWSARAGARGRQSGAMVVECSIPPSAALADAVRAIPCADEPWVAIDQRGQPLGLSYLPSKLLESVPSVGYFDMKEQLLPLLHRLGFGAHPLVVHGDFVDCRTRESYLEMVRRSLRDGAPSISSSARCAPSSRVEGASIIGAGASVEAEALVVDSVVLPGASIGAQSVVARSVVAPGATVTAGALIVDAVVDEFADSMRRAG